MTNQELQDLGLTEEELSTKLETLYQKMKAGKFRIVAGALTPELKESLKAIRTRQSDGRVDLASIDFETAVFVRAVTKIYDKDPNAV